MFVQIGNNVVATHLIERVELQGDVILVTLASGTVTSIMSNKTGVKFSSDRAAKTAFKHLSNYLTTLS